MQPRDEMVPTGQVSLEANSCDEQQVADVVPILLKMTFAVIPENWGFPYTIAETNLT